MSDITFVDFRNGMVSEKLRRRTDLSLYSNSASLIENAVPLRTGGVVEREGLVQLSSGAVAGTRLIPLSVSSTMSFVLVFVPYTSGSTAKNLFIYPVSLTGKEDTIASLNHTYTEAELKELTYGQTFDMMVLAHRNHKPQTITWEEVTDQTGKTTYAFSLKDFTLKYKRTVYKNGAEVKDVTVDDYTYEDFLDSGNYPAGVTFVANRLAFYNFKNTPYGFYLSKPFEYTDFQESVMYATDSTNLTKGLYLKALELQASSLSEKGQQTGKSGTTYEGSYKKTETTVSSAGYYTTTETIVDENAVVKESYVKTKVYVFTCTDKTKDTWSYTEKRDAEGNVVYEYASVYFTTDTVNTKEVTTDDCAIRLELASDRDETICWLAQMGDYVYVGTTSSEWVIPSSITALSVQCSKIASYGSKDKIAPAYGMRNIFYVQTGGKKIRSIQYDSSGIGYSEMSYSCPELFERGIVQMVWQRIPEPRLYVRTADEPNTLYVLCYDADYSVNAWCKWTFENAITGLCVVDTTEGQKVAVVSNNYLCTFTEKTYTDCGATASFVPKLITNNLDSYNYMTYGKRTYVINADTDGTSFSARSLSPSSPSSSSPIPCRVVNGQLSRIEAYTPSNGTQGTRIEIKGKGGEAFTVLALMIDTEVTR